jgi:murein lipoprotein
MRHILISLTAVSLLALTGCATESKKSVATTQPATPAISADAKAALDKAEAVVKEAKAKYALWTTADSAITAAEEAATKGDSEGVIKNAKTAEQQAQLGLEQAKMPPLQLKNL